MQASRLILKPERFALTLSPCLYLVSFSLFKRRPEPALLPLYVVETYTGCDTGYVARGIRDNASDAAALKYWLDRVDSRYYHRAAEVSA